MINIRKEMQLLRQYAVLYFADACEDYRKICNISHSIGILILGGLPTWETEMVSLPRKN